MELDQAILQIFEEWRLKRGLTKADVGAALRPSGTEKSRFDAWDRLVRPRTDLKKTRQLTVQELDALADFFGVNLETVTLEARIRLGRHSGRSDYAAEA